VFWGGGGIRVGATAGEHIAVLVDLKAPDIEQCHLHIGWSSTLCLSRDTLSLPEHDKVPIKQGSGCQGNPSPEKTGAAESHALHQCTRKVPALL
jgi:hypothetical protein